MSNKMCRLSEEQLKIKKDFIFNYINAENASTGSTFDANANVVSKNVGTLFAEVNKDINIQLKRSILTQFIEDRWGHNVADEYLQQLEEHLIYANDESAFCLPYCVAIDLYPFIESGLKAFGGETKAPKHLSSYNGGFINLVYALSSQFAGAVAVPAYLFYFHYFAVKEYGNSYIKDNPTLVAQALQEVVYAINQPSSARGFQSVFFNLSIFDKYYFESMLGRLTYPDGSKCEWEEFNELQKFFMRWFNKERTKALLTFPVVTVAMLSDGEKYLDEDMFEFISKELSEGNAFFIYTSDSVDALSSCCLSGEEEISVRYKNNMEEEPSKFKLKDFITYMNGSSDLCEDKFDTEYWIESVDPYELMVEPTKITGILKRPYTGTMYTFRIEDQIVTTTHDHYFLVKNKDSGTVQQIRAETIADNIRKYQFGFDVGCSVFKFTDGDLVSIEYVQNRYVYDIELEKNHYFYANGVVLSNCRLRNSITDQINDFSYSLGAGGIMTGSMNVLTLNVNRFVQNSYNKWLAVTEEPEEMFYNQLHKDLRDQIYLMHKWQIAIKDYFKYLLEKNMMPAYTGHFIDLDKQYLTIGLNGIVESAQFLGLEISNNESYKYYVRSLLKVISDCNKDTVNKYPELKLKMNSEMIPAENVGVKFSQWDKIDGYKTFRDCYNSYFYIVEDESISLMDKFILQGKELTEFLDGGAAAHINLEEYPTQENFKKLMLVAVKTGCFYFCFNVKVTICNECGYIDKHTRTQCSKCHSTNIDYGTRVIGYLKRISNFSSNRQIEESKRYYH